MGRHCAGDAVLCPGCDDVTMIFSGSSLVTQMDTDKGEGWTRILVCFVWSDDGDDEFRRGASMFSNLSRAAGVVVVIDMNEPGQTCAEKLNSAPGLLTEPPVDGAGG
jgi:hypothetical protein